MGIKFNNNQIKSEWCNWSYGKEFIDFNISIFTANKIQWINLHDKEGLNIILQNFYKVQEYKGDK